MKITKQDVISHVVPAIIGIIIGLCLVKCVSKPVDNIKIERDTVVVVDTAYYDRPVAKDSVRTKYVTRWLPAKHDTIDHFVEVSKIMHDTVAVEVPITSKHYGSDTYDAWVSGFEPSLDSIRVYQRTAYVTEIRTVSKPPNKLSLSVNTGIDYGIRSKFWQPYASGELTLNNHKRLQVGIEGGIKKSEATNNFDPFAGAKLKLKIF